MDLIVCADKNWGIGIRGDQPVAIPEDRKFFQRVTMGNVIVLGRKTLATFPNGLPLAGRDNVILTGNRNFSVKNGVIVHDREELLKTLAEYEAQGRKIFCVGGGSVYQMLLPYCKRAHVTKVDYAYECDTYFEDLDRHPNWKKIKDSEEHTYFSVEFYYYLYENSAPLPLA